ncbi:beta-galactosidase [uncultured Victivallis sp.]|uniref:GH39 family glycosyl hydrolase n=1 Tax=uncultured Victivallis sp. TaxID=354118 RepID=UPI0025F0686C|nr:beta-galactosidase [uncultured Victivallis sp.]
MLRFSALFLLCLLPVAGFAVPAEFPWLAFDRYERYTSSFYSGQGKMVSENPGVRIRGNARNIVLRERKFTLVTHNSPGGVVIECTLHSTGRAGIRLLAAADGEAFKTGIVPLVPGENVCRTALDRKGAVKFEGIELVTDGSGVDLTLHKAALSADTDPAAAFEVALDLPGRLALFMPGEPVRLRVTNRADRPLPFLIAGNLTAFYGRALPFRREQTLAAGESTVFPVAEKLPLNGHWTLGWTIRSGEDSRSGEAGFAVLPELPAYRPQKGDFAFGVCSHPDRWAEGEQELEAQAAARLGVRYLRSGVDWSQIQPTPEQFRFERFDHIVDLFGRYGIEVQGMFGFCTRWAAPKETWNAPSYHAWSRAKPELEAWKRYVETTVKHFKGRIRIWEVWNEPDLYAFSHFGVEDYLDLAKAASETVRRTDPELIVFSAGFAGLGDHPGRRDPEFQFKAMRDGWRFFDVHAYHGHANYATYARQIDERLLPLRKKAGVGIPWYANETAVSAIGGTEREQAAALFKKLLFSWSRGAIGYNWYDLRNDGFAPNDPEYHFGLLTNDFQAKPVLSVYHMLARWFRGAACLGELKLPDGCDGFLFRNGGDRLLAVWNEANRAGGIIAVATDAARAERIDMMGNSMPLPLSDGAVLVGITAEPAVIRLADASRAELRDSPVTFSSGAAVPEQPFRLTAEIANPLDIQAEFKLHFVPEKGVAVTPAETAVTLAPGGRRTLDFSGLIRRGVDVGSVRLDYTISGTSFSGTLDVPLRPAVRIPAGDGKYRRRPDFVLDRPEQVVSFCEGDPSLRDRVWTGKDDLSASIYLRREPGVLELYVAVSDDIHIQKERGTGTWKGDGIQFALAVPGRAGAWKIGLARLGNGRPDSFVWESPSGLDAATAAKGITLTTHRDETLRRTSYRARLALDAFGLDDSMLSAGVRFNLLVNDNDGDLREGFIQLAPGISEWKNFDRFPLIVFD